MNIANIKVTGIPDTLEQYQLALDCAVAAGQAAALAKLRAGVELPEPAGVIDRDLNVWTGKNRNPLATPATHSSITTGADMNKFERWLLVLIFRKLFRQGYDHHKNATWVYALIRQVWADEFTEDNVLTTDSMLREAFEITQFRPLEQQP